MTAESKRTAAETADGKPDGQAENVPTLAHADENLPNHNKTQ